MNPLDDVRFRTARAFRKSKDGTVRTAGWIKDGVAGAPGRVRDRVTGLRSDSEPVGPVKKMPTSKGAAATESGSGVWQRTGGAGLMEKARSDHRVAIAWVAGGILLVAWIGWTIYIWTQNGSTAGVGVLISWPAVLAALALVASPFVVVAILIRRMVADGGLTLAVAGGGTAEVDDDEPDDADEPDETDEPDDAEAEDEPDDDSDGDDPDEDSDPGGDEDSK